MRCRGTGSIDSIQNCLLHKYITHLFQQSHVINVIFIFDRELPESKKIIKQRSPLEDTLYF